MKMIPVFTVLSLSLFLVLIPNTHAGENLLLNGNFATGAAQKVPHWVLSPRTTLENPEIAANLDARLIESGDDAHSLSITATKPIKANVWWQQNLTGKGGITYELTVTIKGNLQESSRYGSVQVGLHFLDAKGGWIGFQPIQPTPPFSGDWQKVTTRFISPENTASIGVRLGTQFDGMATVFFKDATLVPVSE